MSTKQSRMEFVSEVRAAAKELLDAIDHLNTLYSRWTAGYSSWLEDPVEADAEAGIAASYGDFTSAIGLKKENSAAVVGTTLSALNTLMAAGHRTNLEKIR